MTSAYTVTVRRDDGAVVGIVEIPATVSTLSEVLVGRRITEIIRKAEGAARRTRRDRAAP